MIGRRPHPFAVVARILGERLQGCTPSQELRAMVRSPSIGWERVLGQASAQLVLPALGAALRDLDLIGSLDGELGAFLLAVHAANVERNNELRDELAAAVGILNRAGIAPVLLKGAIRLVDDLYPDRGWRMLRDLDLLIPDAEWAAAIGALERAGYARPGPGAHEWRRPEDLAQIDLHREVFPTPGRAGLLPAAEILNRSRPAAFRDGTVRVPAIADQLVHLIGHSQIRHFGYAFGRITLRDRLEAAALLTWAPQAIDWPVIAARFGAAGRRRPLLVFLLALNDGGLCAAPVPARLDLVTVLQQRRIALQARSAALAYIGSRAGWWASAFTSQIEEREGGERKAIRNLKRLLSERGAPRRMVQAFVARQRHLLHLLPHLGWFGAL